MIKCSIILYNNLDKSVKEFNAQSLILRDSILQNIYNDFEQSVGLPVDLHYRKCVFAEVPAFNGGYINATGYHDFYHIEVRDLLEDEWNTVGYVGINYYEELE